MSAKCLKIRECSMRPVQYIRGYDNGSLISLYYFMSGLLRTFHSLSPKADLHQVALSWNRENKDPFGYIEKVIEKVWSEIADADRNAEEHGQPAPVYAVPESPVVIPSNLRHNDYMDVVRLIDDVIDVAWRCYYA